MDFDKWVIARLMVHGVYNGAADGAPGRAMVAGLRRFQSIRNLPINGLADQATVDALRLPAGRDVATTPAVPVEPVWMREAKRFMGLKEIAGPKSNPVIIGWAKRLGGWVAGFFTNDDIPWCGLAMAHWISVTLPRETLPANPLSALAYKAFGRACRPTVGAVLIFERKGGGHVGLYVGEDESHFHVLGANQQNSVSVTRIDKTRLVASRWPTTGGEAPLHKVRLNASGAVSRNEA